MNIFKKIADLFKLEDENWFQLKEKIQYFILNVEDRNKATNNKPGYYSGGFEITVKIVKTINQFGRETKTEKIQKFDNWHRRNGGWTFFNGNWGNDGWNMLINDDCETFKFAPINSQWLREMTDKYAPQFGYNLMGEWIEK